MSTAIAILEPCPKARRVKTTIKRRDVYKYKCDTLCPLCKGTASVMTCPDCDGCGLKIGGVFCQLCQGNGKVPGQKSAA